MSHRRVRVVRGIRDSVSARTRLVLLMLLFLSLAACKHCSCPSAEDTKLTLPNVHAVSALTPILAADSDRSTPALLSVTPYDDLDSSRAPRVLLSIHGAVYALDLSAPGGSAAPVAASTAQCLGAALTSDDRSLACVGSDDPFARFCAAPCRGNVLTLARLSTDWPPALTVEQRLLASDVGVTYSSPTWSPDGRHLAVVESGPNGPNGAPTMLTLLTRGGSATTLAVTGYMHPRTGLGLRIHQIAWSPDGSYLAMLQESVVSPAIGMGLVPMTAIPPEALSDTAHPPTVEFAPQFLTTPPLDKDAWLAWTPDSKGVTFLNSPRLETIAVPAGATTTTLLSFPTDRPAGAGPFAWLADGRSLLFSYGTQEAYRAARPASGVAAALTLRQGACACVFPPAVIYLYTAS